jgi:dihydropyrimidinase
LGATAPARIFGLAKKGTVAVGMDADVVIFDPEAKGVRSARTHHSKADRSIFEGFDVRGKVERTIVGGRVAFENGKLMAERGSGRFISRKPTHFARQREVNA